MSDQALGYSLTFDNVQLGAAAIDIVTIIPTSPLRVAILDIELGIVEGTVGAGDANEQFGRWSIVRGHTAVGSGGVALTPSAQNPDREGPSFTARRGDTTGASGGTPVNLYCGSFPIRAGILYRPKKIVIPRVKSPELLVIRLLATLSPIIRCSFTCHVVEYDSGLLLGI